MTTNSNTIDTFTGNVLDGVTLKAPKGASVVSPTSTMVVESNLTVDEVATALGLPTGFDLDFNPFAENADPTMAAAVEKTSQMVITTLTAISSSGEGAGLSKQDAFDMALEAVVSVVKTNVETKQTIDFSNPTTLEEIQEKATEKAVEKGVSESAFNIAIDSAIEKTKSANKNIKEIDNDKVFAEESKNIFNEANSIAEETKSFADTLNTALQSSPAQETGVVSRLSVKSVATDNIVNGTEKTNGFLVTGICEPGKTIKVTLADGLEKEVLADKNTGEWTADFTTSSLTNAQQNILTNLSYPLTVKASSEGVGGIVFTAEKKVELVETKSSITINNIGGSDSKVNIPEWDVGLKVSGTTDGGIGSEVKVTILNDSDQVISGLEDIKGTVDSAGAWSVTLPTGTRPTGDFKERLN